MDVSICRMMSPNGSIGGQTRFVKGIGTQPVRERTFTWKCNQSGCGQGCPQPRSSQEIIMKQRITFSILAMIAIALSACGSRKALNVTDVWARPGNTDGNSAVYFI